MQKKTARSAIKFAGFSTVGHDDMCHGITRRHEKARQVAGFFERRSAV
ncbi:hypothetical protein [Pseudomonas sp. GCEP-101]|nr:hypothetical protein [Pseudomonas sp. GCEP-101]